MSRYFSPGSGGFFDTAIHAIVPSDAVPVTDAEYDALFEAQANGAIIKPHADGHPVAVPLAEPTLDERRARAVDRVKREAARRIDLIAPVWRQMNAIREGVPLDWSAIDAIREASDVLEAMIATSSAAQLAALDVAANDNWPATAAA
ncbi:hypothetical protein [Sphingomonas cavernae]|uniref:Tail fiber assembly protein n=1 Tax=Sphingomonas cavernae TaxID=2320861 RepID=A0A418WP23_9SPHN|nr:hypothetical protein [Sphingomonas cavernae]RJF92987.1 hypothetical protein D3876_00955 [Sphingomonas cavernae]